VGDRNHCPASITDLLSPDGGLTAAGIALLLAVVGLVSRRAGVVALRTLSDSPRALAVVPVAWSTVTGG
jgi:hypothetical protein